MKHYSRLGIVCVLGTVLIVAAGLYQQRLLSGRHHRPNLTPALHNVPPVNVPSPDQEAALRSAVTADPNDPQARWALARFYQHSGQAILATQQLDSLSRLVPKASPAQVTLAGAWLSLKRGDRAEPAYRHWTTVQPKNKAAWQGLALCLYQQQRYYEATRTAWQANQLDPNDNNGRYLLGSAALAYAKQFPNKTHDTEMSLAQEQFEALIQAWPTNPEAFYKLGQADLGIGDADKAILHLRRALELSPRPDVSEELAHAYAVKGDTGAARQTVEAGLARDPNDAALHDQRGQLLQDTDDAQALIEYQTADRLAPHTSRFMEGLAAAYLRAGRLPEAQAEFQQMIRQNPSRTFPYQQLAIIETRLGHAEEAAQDARMATRMNAESQSLLRLQSQSSLHPEDAAMHLQLATRFQALGLKDAARDERLVAAGLRPGNARARNGSATLKPPPPK